MNFNEVGSPCLTNFFSNQICFWPGNILLGLTQIEDESKKRKFRKFADTFLKSCIETWKDTSTTIAPESWSWTPQNNDLQTKLDRLNKDKSNRKEKRANNRPFRVDNSIYDLRPGRIYDKLPAFLYQLLNKVFSQKLLRASFITTV